MSATMDTTTTTKTKRVYRKQPIVLKTFINKEQKKAIMKAFKNVPKEANKYNKKVEKQAKVDERKEAKEMREREKKEVRNEAKDKVSNMNMEEKEVLLRHIYSDIFDALKNIAKFTKPKMAIFISALDKKTTQSELTKAYLSINKGKGKDGKNKMSEELEEEKFVEE
jgi:vacuolar-type H+-ATPase subunit E/Vma4